MNFSEAVKKASELGIAFDHEEFGFIFFDADRTNCNVKGFDTLFGIGSNSYNIKQSIVSNVAGIENKDEYKYSYARVLFDETEGMNFDIAANREVFVEDVLNYIYGKVPTEAGAYDAIIATGYSTVVLDKPLTEHDMELAEKRFDDPEYVFSDEEVKSCADTDRDGLFDFEEVMFYSDCAEENEFIKFKNGHIELPQVADIMRIFEVNGIYAYVDGGVEEARKQYGDCWAIFLTEPVLPIISDPTSVDGDGDGLPDGNDPVMLSCNNNSEVRDNLLGVNIKNVASYYWVNNMYYDPTIKNNGNSIEYYYNLYNVNPEQAQNTKADITILQKCLEFLGYLDMTNYEYNGFGQLIDVSKASYGTLGGLTKAAVKLYQSNHKLDSEYIIENDIVDDTTFYSIILAAMNYGYEFSELEKEYCNQAKFYFNAVYKPKSFPMNTIDDIPIVTTVSTQHNEIYFYDLTIPFNKILQHGAQEFHASSYDCDLMTQPVYPYSVIKWYSDCSKMCEYDSLDLIWLCSKVKNNAKYDIKTKKSWHDLFHIVKYDFMFYGSKYPFVYNGNEVNAEQFGNILFGFCCNAGAYPLHSISLGGSVYSLLTTGKFDNIEDTEMVKKGFEMFEEYSDNYIFLHEAIRNEEY